MVESVFRESFVMKKFVDFIYILPDLGKVQRSEILEETLIYKVLN